VLAVSGVVTGLENFNTVITAGGIATRIQPVDLQITCLSRLKTQRVFVPLKN